MLFFYYLENLMEERKKEKRRRNNAKFSGSYVRQHIHNVRAHALLLDQFFWLEVYTSKQLKVFWFKMSGIALKYSTSTHFKVLYVTLSCTFGSINFQQLQDNLKMRPCTGQKFILPTSPRHFKQQHTWLVKSIYQEIILYYMFKLQDWSYCKLNQNIN